MIRHARSYLLLLVMLGGVPNEDADARGLQLAPRCARERPAARPLPCMALARTCSECEDIAADAEYGMTRVHSSVFQRVSQTSVPAILILQNSDSSKQTNHSDSMRKALMLHLIVELLFSQLHWEVTACRSLHGFDHGIIHAGNRVCMTDTHAAGAIKTGSCNCDTR